MAPAEKTTPRFESRAIVIRWPMVWLLLEAFTIGMLDAVTVPALKVFVGMQTGTLVYLALGAAALQPRYPTLIYPVRCVTQLTSAWLAMFVTGLINNRVRPRHRLTMVAEFFVQAMLVILVAALLYGEAWNIEKDADAYGIICLLSLCTGSQQITVKYFEIPEVNTTMVTIPIADVLSDPHLLRIKNRPRDNRIAFTTVFVVGAIVGGCCLHWVNYSLAIIISGGIKMFVSAAMLFMPSEKDRSDLRPSG